MSTPEVGANSIFLPLKGPLEMMRESLFIYLYPPNAEVKGSRGYHKLPIKSLGVGPQQHTEKTLKDS
jgi:hypothetical protein